MLVLRCAPRASRPPAFFTFALPLMFLAIFTALLGEGRSRRCGVHRSWR
jgi:hypothetical protein